MMTPEEMAKQFGEAINRKFIESLGTFANAQSTATTEVTVDTIREAMRKLGPRPPQTTVLISPLALAEMPHAHLNPFLPLSSFAGLDLHGDRSGLVDGYITGPPEMMRKLIDLCERAADGDEFARDVARMMIEKIRAKSTAELCNPP